MRKFALIAAGATLALGTAAPAAMAGPDEFKLTVSTSGAKGGTKTRPRAQSLTTRFDVIKNGTITRENQFATTKTTIWFDRNFKFNYRKFTRTCSAATVLRAPNSCPVASRVGNGNGKARNYATPNDPSPLAIRAFQGPNQKLFIRVETNQPTNVRGIIVGTISRSSGLYGSKLVARIPGKNEEATYGNLQNPLGDVTPTLSEFLLTTGATYKRIPYIQSTGCTRGQWKFKARLEFTDGSVANGTDTAACRK